MSDTMSAGSPFASQGLPEFESIMKASTSADAMIHVEKAVQALGFKQLLFALISSPKAGSKDLYLQSTYPQEWREHYEKHNLRADDPTVAHCFKSMSPFVWLRESFQTRAQQHMYEEAASFGLHHGVTLPMRGLDGEVGMLTCVRDETSSRSSIEDLNHNLGKLTLLRDVAFDAIFSHVKPEAVEQPPPLTARELDCLQWIAAGKTTWEVGRILNISEAGVNFHVHNLRTKFGVSRRHDVVIKAIRMGLISLP